jgi:peptidoglycan/LPS O-acetylase OafA/YrhL
MNAMQQSRSDTNRVNNFDALRFCAAVAVLISHSFPLSYGSNEWEPLHWLSQGQTTLGGVAVLVFFVISGYLITLSFERARNVWQYARARARRILPGLVVVTCLLAFVVGPIVSALPLGEYFTHASVYRYGLVDTSMVKFVDDLPGVFRENPMPGVVDGSLWTLRFEAHCYVLVAVLGVSRALNKYVAIALFGILLAGVALIPGNHHVSLTAAFVGGMVMYYWRPALDGRIAVVCTIALVMCVLFGGFDVGADVFGSYVVIYLALSPSVHLPNVAKHGDLSYGIYIYAFPVQQIVSSLLGEHAAWQWNAAISMPVVLGLAFLSWHYVEKVALSFKGSRVRVAASAWSGT